VSRIAALLRVPPLALRMFRSANEMSGLDRRTLPTELIPLNAIQLSRGLLNFTALQSLPGWLLPYWAVRQFDPSDPGFIPRSHLGLSINLTRRNWTAVGMPGCPNEPIIDPRGLVTPFRNGWSFDVWVRTGKCVLFPSRLDSVHQRLSDDVPVVETSFDSDGLAITLTTYTHNSVLTHHVAVKNSTGEMRDGAVAIAIRPFNPEGVALTYAIRFEQERNRFVVDETQTVTLSSPPTALRWGSNERGDSAGAFGRAEHADDIAETRCPLGFANGHAVYAFSLEPGGTFEFTAQAPLQDGEEVPAVATMPQAVVKMWNDLLQTGAQIETPDQKVNALLRASLATVLQLTDGDTITPGPWTYHQFWFRDAAAMVRALDVFGFHHVTRSIIEQFPSHQQPDGYFRSQQGEWDSNGEALWTAWQHIALTGNDTLARQLFEPLSRGVEWIRRKRLTGREHKGTPYEGLLPAGLSAEHLGLADHYFWDNWWSMAGVSAFIRICERVGKPEAARSAEALLHEYRTAMERAIARTGDGNPDAPIPAGPERRVDCGMIGTCVTWYPLQEIAAEDCRMRATLETLAQRFLVDGMFFQDFIHSGMNAYLTLHLAHAWLHEGNRSEFWKLFSAVAAHASPTLNFPEAIHPQTGGGSMGDGHHGWAAAEICLALRDAFVREVWKDNQRDPELVMLSGIPAEWFQGDGQFSITEAPVPGGTVSIECVGQEGRICVLITLTAHEQPQVFNTSVRLPLIAATLRVNGGAARNVRIVDGETWVECGKTGGKTMIECDVA
ncbi:MAG: hypothetical protein AB1428_12535, partial [Bacteroidota bacterium]